ncbi:MAG: preprotein translocase subunit SecG [Bacillota bacterium]
MTALKVLHLIASLGVIVGVLLQSGKSAGLSGAIDGGATQFFGSGGRKLEEKINKATMVAAIAFMLLSFLLAVL